MTSKQKRVADLKVGDITVGYGKIVRIGESNKNGRKALKIHYDSNAVVIFRDLEMKVFLR